MNIENISVHASYDQEYKKNQIFQLSRMEKKICQYLREQVIFKVALAL